MLYMGIILVVAGVIVYVLQRTNGLFMRTAMHRTLPKFLIANGVFLPIPWHWVADGLLAYLLWVVLAEIYHHTGRGRSNVD